MNRADNHAINHALIRPDAGPNERWQHASRTWHVTETPGVAAARNPEESLLDRLLLVGLLSSACQQAGLRWREDYWQAGLGAPLVGSYKPIRVQSSYREYERSEAEEAAYRRWRQALMVLPVGVRGATQQLACEDVLVDQKQLAQAKIGLTSLVSYYKI